MYKATYFRNDLKFKIPGGTSRGVLKTKPTWFIKVWNKNNPEKVGIGEVSIIPKLSIDGVPHLEDKIAEVCKNINQFKSINLTPYPSIEFALETAMQDLNASESKILYPSDFTNGKKGIPINGLIWMGDKAFMGNQIKEKLEQGFTCIKIKIGAIDFETEYEILKSLRKIASESELTIRVDANGAFNTEQAKEVLGLLSKLKIHSIEQPIKQGQHEQMRELCSSTPTPIALDEELIGINSSESKLHLIEYIKPQYAIFKPSLLGGLNKTNEWIDACTKNKTDWWITSALESNIGLNAIAQYTYTLPVKNHQGLGTGQLFTNNITSPLAIKGERLYYRTNIKWDLI